MLHLVKLDALAYFLGTIMVSADQSPMARIWFTRRHEYTLRSQRDMTAAVKQSHTNWICSAPKGLAPGWHRVADERNVLMRLGSREKPSAPCVAATSPEPFGHIYGSMATRAIVSIQDNQDPARIPEENTESARCAITPLSPNCVDRGGFHDDSRGTRT